MTTDNTTEELEQTRHERDDLAKLVGRLVLLLRDFDPDDLTAEEAMCYLKCHRLLIIRGAE